MNCFRFLIHSVKLHFFILDLSHGMARIATAARLDQIYKICL